MGKQMFNYQHLLYRVEEIWRSEKSDPELQRIKQSLEKGKSPRFVVHEDGTLRFQNHLCIPKNEELRK